MAKRIYKDNIIKHLFRWFMKSTGIFPTWLAFRPKYYYEDKSIQNRKVKGRAIIASNHQSPMDPILVMSVFVRRYLHCVVGEVIYDNYKKLGFFLNLLGSVKAERFIASPKFINECNDILQHNGVIQIYPEGRLPTKMEHDKILPFKVSVALLSIQSNAPIIPIYHTGKYGAGKTQTVVIGKPINLRDHCSELNPSPEKLKALTKIIEDKVIQLKLMIPNETKEENK